MIDIHHHLLFGLDDGSPDLSTSVEMAKIAVADGITHVVCTPHASGAYAFDPVQIATRAAAIREALAAASIPLTLGLGCDFHMSYDNIQEALTTPAKFSINGGHFLLVELPDFGLTPTLNETFYQMQLAGITPILTHPERNSTLQKDPARLVDWVRSGVLIQITANSLTGEMGKPAEQMSHRLLADRWVHFIATDAHNTTTRPPRMSTARDIVAKRYSAAYADLLCTENPRAVFDATPLGPQQEPLHLFDDRDPSAPWWKRLLRKQ
jgi:protein-tyrosine phosphatase